MNISMIYLRQLLAACLLIVAFAACNDDENPTGGSVKLLSDSEIVCLAGEEEAEITLSATGNWAAVPSKGWLKLGNIQGASGDNQKIKVAIAANETFSQRVGTVVIKDKVSGESVEVKFTQGAKDAIFVFSEATTTLLIDKDKREIWGQVKVTSNYEWSISIPENVSWLTYQIGEREGNSCTVRFYAEPDKMDNYNARDAQASFNYVSATRTPAAENHKVIFEGIKPEVTFNRPYGETGLTNISLEDMDGSGKYKATVIVKSNIAWTLKDLPSFLEVNLLNGNESAKFFETETNLVLTLKEGQLDTETLTNKLQLYDASFEKPTSALNIQVLGVGEHYTYIDQEAFKPESALEPYYMFKALSEDGYSPVLKRFLVKASSQEKVVFYMVKLESSWGYPVKEGVNDWGDPISNDVTNRWGGVDPVESSMTRRPVEGNEWEIWIKSRADWGEWQSDPKKERYFALFAVSTDQAPTYDDLFDAEGNLKEEFSNKAITLGQKAKPINYFFYSPDVTEGDVLKVGAAGKKFTIGYESDAESMTFYENVVRYSDDPFDWNGGTSIMDSEMLSADFKDGKIYLTVKPNKSGAKRSTSCGIGNYQEGKLDYLLINFTIEQEAE